MTITKEGMITASAAAKIIGCSTAHVRRLLIAGDIEGDHIEPSGFWMADKRSVEKFAKTSQKTGRPRGS